jgi:hypothetical protein
MNAVGGQWHAFLFPGLIGFFLFCSFCSVASNAFSYKNLIEHKMNAQWTFDLITTAIPDGGHQSQVNY